MNEVWKPIYGYTRLYAISNLGRVKSLERWRKTKNNSKQLKKILNMLKK